ncbi:MAG: hypothetical protein MJ157_04030, partial [Clostridia bacterium]|nr:hypothetical protein [Clostridia bacterium]
MKKAFLKWVLLFISLAFLLTLVFSFALQTKHSRENAFKLLELKIEDAEKQIQQNNKNLITLREMNHAEALAKTHALAKILEATPGADLQELLTILDVDEIDLIDQAGIVTNCTNSKHINYDMASAKQSQEFLSILDNPQLEIVQEPQATGYDSSVTMQYAGVARLDQPGIVQIGYYPGRLYEAMEVADITNISSSLRIGTNGSIVVIQDQKIL